ncbi:MAG: hypothetical protein E6Q78_09075 [Rhodoferax sp.]|nr:MAG: hypothetical protein E6Q78_09075 [Rhodoferax sp.]
MEAPRVIRIEVAAPPKPAWGEACNGCGVCCLTEPCPIGIVWSRRRHGACTALVWDAEGGGYRCGALQRAQVWPPLAHLVRRWIAAGKGCDCDWEPTNAIASSNQLNKQEDCVDGSQ